ncbi:uncharacterized protein LOC132616711 [Lycium barbarum]|uniref:uncharacterized protein LOC132616711 n=1 Tax=Lycium barbarum TaxID=112863 RepID=UPI00293E1841|nr:uncharacterized protein LOC132616711 [Lycium barbarum]XP_060187286.1 uncharacterized protein LOC132616711 [Lycium barbarum]
MRHEGKVSITKLIYQVMHTLIQFMKVRRRNFRYAPYNWSVIVEALQRYSPKIRVTPVTWRTPDIGWIKVNTDGASRGNSGRSSWAFCVRDERGDVIQAQAREIEDLQSTNTEAEALAILQALRYLKDSQWDQIRIETDSLLLKNSIQRTWEIPWQIITMVEEIWRISEEKVVVIEHIYREGNKLVDHLANLALDTGDIQFNSFHDMESHCKRIVNSDKLQLPCLRIRSC